MMSPSEPMACAQTPTTGHILVVDDEEYIAIGLALLLGQHGFRVSQAHDGATAVALASAEKPDLVLLDVDMPHMDGFGVCEQLKASDEMKDIPVIFLTTKRGDDASIARGIEMGGLDYLHKPFSEQELLVRVRIALDLRSAREASVNADHFRAIARLAVTINDSINSPLAAISGYAQLMAARLRDLEPSQLGVFLQRIEQSVDHIQEFIERFHHIVEPVISESPKGELSTLDMERATLKDA